MIVLRPWLFAVEFLGWEPQPWWGRLGANCYREAPRILQVRQLFLWVQTEQCEQQDQLELGFPAPALSRDR